MRACRVFAPKMPSVGPGVETSRMQLFLRGPGAIALSSGGIRITNCDEAQHEEEGKKTRHISPGPDRSTRQFCRTVRAVQPALVELWGIQCKIG